MTAANESTRSGACVLEMTDLSISRLNDPGALVLAEVNWSVAAGDYWFVAGRHHSGKTDFLMTAAGLMPPRAGAFRILGKDREQRDEFTDARRRVGLVFDGGQLLGHLTVAENIALPISYHRNCPVEETAHELAALLDLADLSHLANRKPASIGRNWRQRTGLARALALKPEVLLVDSPLSALDPLDVAWWLDILDELSAGHPWMDRRPVTLIVTGADLRPWQKRAHQFALIKNQRLLSMRDADGERLHEDPLWQELIGKRLTETAS